MITIENEFSCNETYPLSRLGNPEELLFFDIETTGFSGDYNTVYLIGCAYQREGSWRFIQWFSDSPAAEREVLTAFFSFSESFQTLVHFNGDTFDIPFLLKRCVKLRLPHSFDRLESVDIYKKIKPWKKHLGLTSLKQKAIETFLGIDREDLYNGGQLIEVYREYLLSKDPALLRLLLLHNEDDLKGMPALLPILFYPDFFTGDFTLKAVREIPGPAPKVALTLQSQPDTLLPIPLRGSLPAYELEAKGNTLCLSIRIYEGTLKYFYPNPRDYYYLIFEDMAVHKSVGQYVEPEARIKATKETCYTKKSGLFLPQPSPLFAPDFKNSCGEKTCFFEYAQDCFLNAPCLSEYVRQIIKTVLGGK